ncbi:hypothetical protein BJX70DRAFT_122577 [Aspergillus crustosus]
MAATGEEAVLPHRHPPKPLPFELVQHVGIFFEERLHTQALGLLMNALSSHPDASTPVFIPSPQHLALAVTFLVHPSTTGRTKTTGEAEAPGVSLRLLRLVNSLVGPAGAQFNTAFLFTHFETSRHGGRRHLDDGRPSSTNRLTADGQRKPLNLDRDIDIDLAHSASLWSRAEDFWHAVGWAFNCAVLHPARWECWRSWLEFMCEVLEEDWQERWTKDHSPDSPALRNSLIFHYITKSSHGFGRNRRILRAIFADGGTTAANEFREVFHRELKLSRKKAAEEKDSKKREAAAAVDIDAEEYGDFYLTTDNEDGEGSSGRESKRPRRSKATTSKETAAVITKTKPITDSTDPDPTLSSSLLGDINSLGLRQRLLHLLSAVSQALPKHFMELEELYQLFVENIRPLPLPIYQAFVSPFALPYFSPPAHSTLCEFLLYRLRESAAPGTDDEYLTQAKLETCFLPYAAATPSLSDNTKMSITLETLIMLLADSDMLQVTEETKLLTKKGITRRAQKAQAETRKNQFARKSEDLEWSWLGESAERLTFLVEVVPISSSGSGTGNPSLSPSSRSSGV